MIGYDPGPVRIEASQKGWLLVRVLTRLIYVITCIEASSEHDWDVYFVLKQETIRAFEQFEQWHGRY